MYGRKGRKITSVVLLLKVETDLGRVSIVVVDREEQHDAQDWCWQHGQQVRLKAPHILDRPLVRDPEFPQEQVHHLQRRVSLQVVHHYPCKTSKQTSGFDSSGNHRSSSVIFVCCNEKFVIRSAYI